LQQTALPSLARKFCDYSDEPFVAAGEAIERVDSRG